MTKNIQTEKLNAAIDIANPSMILT